MSDNRNDMDALAAQTEFSQRAITELVDFVERGKRAQDAVDAAVAAADWPLIRVISGGQTGADQAGLRAGKALGYKTGGMMPKGYRTEDGPRPEFAELYGCIRSAHSGYEHRTRWNVQHSDGTIVFYLGVLDGGSDLTVQMATALNKPVLSSGVYGLTVPSMKAVVEVELIRQWIRRHQIHTLNVAGNRESKAYGIGATVEALLRVVLNKEMP
jgi:hypothetical protein